MRKLTPFLVAIVVLLLPAMALAGDSSSSGGGMDDLGKTIAVVITGAVVAIGERFWGWISHKRGAAKIAQQIDVHALEQMIAEDAIDYVDELAHRALKPGAKALDAVEKEAAARGYAKEMAAARKLAKDSADRIAKIVVARLGASRKPPKPAGSVATLPLKPR